MTRTLKPVLLAVILLFAANVFAEDAKPKPKKSKEKPKATKSNWTPPYTGAELAKLTSDPDRIVTMVTKQGTIKIQLFDKLAPKHVANMIKLVKSHFYDGLYFHRCIPGFMIQGGDPNTRDNDLNNDGMGGSPDRVPAEFSAVHHARGVLSAARTNDPNSATSQFFLCNADAGSLDHQYTVYGQVISGMDAVDKITALPKVQGDNPGKAATIIKATISDKDEKKSKKK